MSGYDGSIRINTEILVKSAEKQLRALENSMDKTATKAASLRDKMDAMRTVKIPTQEYAALDKELSSLGAKYDRIAERQQKFLEAGGKENSRTYRGMAHDLDMIDEKQNSVISQMKELENTGKAFTLGSSTEEYARIGQQLKFTEASLETMNRQHEIVGDRLDAALQKREAEREKLNQIAAEEKRLAQIRENASVADQELIDLLERRREVMQEITDLEKAGVGEGYQEYYDAQSELSNINGQIDAIRKARDEQEEMSSSYVRLSDAARNAFNIMAQGLKDIPLAAIRAGIDSVISGFKRLGDVVQSSAVAPFKLLEAVAKKALSGIGKSSKGTNNIFQKGFKNILKYGLGIRSIYALLNKFRTAVKEGFKNLAQVSEPVNASISSLKSSLTQLKNSLATAFAPILTTITPLLTSFINMLSKAAVYVGMFTAALTGKGSFIKAVAVQEDYAASLEKTGGAAKKAVKALAGFDKLNVLGKSDSDSGTGGINPEDMFEEITIPDSFKNIAQQLKEMWRDSDFYELGKYLGEKLKEALDSIPWDEIKEKARNLGKSFATLINGFIEVDGLGYSIGRTLAEAFNTGFEFLNSFVHELHWDSLGKFIAETLNGIFENIDWDLIYDTFVTGAKGLRDAVNSFADNLNWNAVATTISNFINTFVDTIYTFITTVDWSSLGEKIGKTLSDAWTGIDWAKAGETLGEYFKAFFNFVGKAIEAVDWWAVGESVKDFLVGIDWAGVADSFFEAVGAAFGGLAAFLGGLIAEGVVSAGEYFQDKIQEAGGNVVEGILVGIAEALVSIGEWIKEHIFKPFLDGFKRAFDINSPSKVMAEMGTYIIQGLLDGITSLVDKVTETWGSMKETAVEIWENVKEALSETWDSMKEKATEIWENLQQFFTDTWDDIRSVFEGIVDFLLGIFTGDWERAWDGIVKIFDGVWSSMKRIINSILGGVEMMANGVVNAINTMIRALNNFKVDFPDWVPLAGGKTLGFSIPEINKVSIPRLADGAVIRGGDPFMAVLGDQRRGQTNIEAPLATIRQAVRDELRLHGNNNRDSGNGSYVFQVDGKTFFEITRGEAQRYFSRTGKSPYPT